MSDDFDAKLLLPNQSQEVIGDIEIPETRITLRLNLRQAGSQGNFWLLGEFFDQDVALSEINKASRTIIHEEKFCSASSLIEFTVTDDFRSMPLTKRICCDSLSFNSDER